MGEHLVGCKFNKPKAIFRDERTEMKMTTYKHLQTEFSLGMFCEQSEINFPLVFY